MEGGSIIIKEIIAAIDDCDEAMVLESPSTRRKPDWVVFEIGAARGQHKRVTPILNNVDPQKVGPATDRERKLKDLKIIDRRANDLNEEALDVLNYQNKCVVENI